MRNAVNEMTALGRSRAATGLIQVTLRMTQHRHYAAVERVISLCDRPFLRVAVPIVDSETLERFAVADPLRNGELKRQYDQILYEYDRIARARSAGAPLELNGHPDTGLDGIQGCVHPAELDAIVRPFVQAHGASQYLFAVLQMHRDKPRPARYRYLCGYDPEWTQLYLHQHRWFVHDRSVARALDGTEPILSSSVQATTPEQHEMLRQARDHQIGSWIAFPVHHHRSKDWLGILYVANDHEPRAGGEELMLRSKIALRTLSAEIFNWKLQHLRMDFATRHRLSAKELRVLQFACEGFASGDVAERLGLSVRTVYDLNTSISQKMAVGGIREAARLAWDEGLPC